MALACMAIVLITKVRGEYRGIGLVKVTWKVYVFITDNRLRAATTFHKALHGFRYGRETGTATMDAK